MTGVEVEVVLDLRCLPDRPATPAGFAALWGTVERLLDGYRLQESAAHDVDVDAGRVRIEVVRVDPAADVVNASTRFGVVAVREPAHLLYRCRVCHRDGDATYGPFTCSECGASGDGDRLCDRHVVILDGSLTATCPDHRPTCSATPSCSRTAVFRCAGPRCNRVSAWCAAHRRAHRHDADVDFCPPCYDQRFPRCDSAGCEHVGTVRCEHVDPDSWRTCGRRSCAVHTLRWQVFGPERLGLGRCGEHRDLRRLSPREVLTQIVAGGVARGRRQTLPRLTGFAHSVRRCGHSRIALDHAGLHATLLGMGRRPGVPQRVVTAVAEHEKRWEEQRRQLEENAARGRELVDRLRALIVADTGLKGDRAAVAAAVSLAQYLPHQRLLFVDVDVVHRGAFLGKKWERARRHGDLLGVVIRLEEDRKTA